MSFPNLLSRGGDRGACVEAWVTREQRKLARYRRLPLAAKCRRDLLLHARWWELEAILDYQSAAQAREYAANLRWLAELARAGHKVIGVPFHKTLAAQARRSEVA